MLCSLLFVSVTGDRRFGRHCDSFRSCTNLLFFLFATWPSQRQVQRHGRLVLIQRALLVPLPSAEQNRSKPSRAAYSPRRRNWILKFVTSNAPQDGTLTFAHQTSYTSPPEGFTYVPVGTPDLSERCKQLSKQRGLPVYIVNVRSPRILWHARERGNAANTHLS